ncbi:hypothetical protein ZOSMA_118G00450 [Zostera marina]|uniref:At2g35280-like TPR domain-containing protein n=1 Tax=Zostera marina TaxID=29655 RepID=A0A0K9Q3Y9_ZOSMR|nr:hypothetical protein ZOSMA_118G00450 [Zostera marina]
MSPVFFNQCIEAENSSAFLIRGLDEYFNYKRFKCGEKYLVKAANKENLEAICSKFKILGGEKHVLQQVCVDKLISWNMSPVFFNQCIEAENSSAFLIRGLDEYFNYKRFKCGEKYLLKAANKENLEAMYVLGMIYFSIDLTRIFGIRLLTKITNGADGLLLIEKINSKLQFIINRIWINHKLTALHHDQGQKKGDCANFKCNPNQRETQWNLNRNYMMKRNDFCSVFCEKHVLQQVCVDKLISWNMSPVFFNQCIEAENSSAFLIRGLDEYFNYKRFKCGEKYLLKAANKENLEAMYVLGMIYFSIDLTRIFGIRLLTKITNGADGLLLIEKINSKLQFIINRIWINHKLTALHHDQGQNKRDFANFKCNPNQRETQWNLNRNYMMKRNDFCSVFCMWNYCYNGLCDIF